MLKGQSPVQVIFFQIQTNYLKEEKTLVPFRAELFKNPNKLMSLRVSQNFFSQKASWYLPSQHKGLVDYLSIGIK